MDRPILTQLSCLVSQLSRQFHQMTLFRTLTFIVGVSVSMMRVCANTWSMYRRYIYTYTHKYSDLLIDTISVGLAQARPNKHMDVPLSIGHFWQCFPTLQSRFFRRRDGA